MAGNFRREVIYNGRIDSVGSDYNSKTSDVRRDARRLVSIVREARRGDRGHDQPGFVVFCELYLFLVY